MMNDCTPLRRVLERHHPWIFTVLLAAVSVPYYFSLANPFSADDWMFLHTYRGRSLAGLFDPHVLWFYRPLQSLLFAYLYRFFQLSPIPYNLASLGLYFAGAALWYGFLVRLLRGPALALAASLFLLASWQFCDTVFWKSNYGALLGWIGTAAVLHAALSDARAPHWRWPALAGAGFLFALLAKETSVNIPILAGLVYLYEGRGELAAAPRRALARVAWRLAPLLVILGGYLAFHRFCVVDVEEVSQKGYQFASPLGVVRHFLMALNHIFFFFDYSPLLGGFNQSFRFIEEKLLFIPLLLGAWALWRRDATLGFALLFAAVALFPVILLEQYHYSRFYLLPASGMALGWAVLVRNAWAGARGWPPRAHKAARIALAVLVVLAVLRSEAQLEAIVRYDRENMRQLARFQECIVVNRAQLPPDACLIFDGVDKNVSGEMGLREMVKILLGSERAEAFRNGSQLTDAYARRLNSEYPNKFRIGLNAQGWVVIAPLGNVQVQRAR